MRFCDCIREYGAPWYLSSVYPYRNVVDALIEGRSLILWMKERSLWIIRVCNSLVRGLRSMHVDP